MSTDNRYQCEACKRVRSVNINSDDHAARVKNSDNGLVYYSDIHRCEDGILGINGVYLDHNCHIRAFSNLQLPTKRKPMKKSSLGLPAPMPTPSSGEDGKPRTFKITSLFPDKDFRIRIIDYRLRVIVQVGEINHKKEKMISLIQSDLGTIDFEYYASDVHFNLSLDKWLHLVVNLLEKLPPTTLGLFIETLFFIYQQYYQYPNAFLIKQLKTLITAHDTYFEIQIDQDEVDDKVKYFHSKYGDEFSVMAKEVLQSLAEDPTITLRYYARTHDQDLVYLINMFLILEQEGVVSIERPGLVEEKIDAEMGYN